jgi:hypothetical protein
MSLLDDLRDGSLGVRLQLPDQLESLEQGPTFARWIDRDVLSTVLAIHSPFPLDLSDPRKPTLRAELEAEARRVFLAKHQSLAAEREAVARPPRTDDPSWSPIVELDLLERADGRLLRCVSRLSYQPGHELIRGVLCCPLANGHLWLALLHRSAQTGMRESVLTLRLNLAEGFEHPGQAFYDDPEHDEAFPQHGLSCVRRGLTRWLSADGGALEITCRQPSAPHPGARITLVASDSSLVPPPGFLHIPHDVMPVASSMSSLARHGLERQPDAMIDVWRLSPEEARPRNMDELIELAEAVARGWEAEGAGNIAVSVEPRERGERIEARARISFTVNGEAKQNIAQWILDRDGAVFRIGLSFEPPDEFDSWEPVLDELVASWRRLSEPKSPNRPWWKLFSRRVRG